MSTLRDTVPNYPLKCPTTDKVLCPETLVGIMAETPETREICNSKPHTTITYISQPPIPRTQLQTRTFWPTRTMPNWTRIHRRIPKGLSFTFPTTQHMPLRPPNTGNKRTYPPRMSEIHPVSGHTAKSGAFTRTGNPIIPPNPPRFEDEPIVNDTDGSDEEDEGGG
ncbi:hypothetical protein CPB84DRAFT_493218 [Gymnopilus junonius]|uniref:Uncharacterized protein n=1 Tax=Gymnopilus junonius TaxID=109634 RepID=A0A9P5P211_GYMJU|nr:hypothetical protein CPB84DRAFT_493218 [Gymnopilus junonius]